MFYLYSWILKKEHNMYLNKYWRANMCITIIYLNIIFQILITTKEHKLNMKHQLSNKPNIHRKCKQQGI